MINKRKRAKKKNKKKNKYCKRTKSNTLKPEINSGYKQEVDCKIVNRITSAR